jgi:disulfide bond formation protein DsbB
MPSLEIVNLNLGIFTIATQVLTIALFAVFLLRTRIPTFGEIAASVSSWSMWAALLVSFGASAMTLIHTELYNLPPCPLCWWQRVFLYPQVILLTIALWKRERTVTYYSIALSIFGLAVALYHHILQIAPPGSLPCPAEGEISCSQILFLEFGYITYPMMGATVFAFLIVLMLFNRLRR